MPAEPLRILFFVEPLIESLHLDFRAYWAHTLATKLAESLKKNNAGQFEIYLLTNEYVAEHIPEQTDMKVVVVSQQKLRASDIQCNAELIITKAATNELSNSEIERFTKIYKKSLGNFIPDVIITWTPAPYIQAAYPNTLLLYSEVGIFSREPFPQTIYFDPVGCPHSAYVVKVVEDLMLAAPLNTPSQQHFDKLRSTIKLYLKQFAWQDEKLGVMRKQYKHMILLTLPMFGNYVTKYLLGNMSMVDFILNVITSLPSDVGVVITEHPLEHIIPPSFVEALQKHHPNVYINLEWRKNATPSDYLLPWVDLVIHVGSKIAFMAAFNGTKVIDLTTLPGHDVLADGKNLKDVADVLSNPPLYRDHIIHWMLMNYTLPWNVLNKPDWLSGFLRRALAHKQSGGALKDFYQPIDDESAVYDHYVHTLMSNIIDLPLPK